MTTQGSGGDEDDAMLERLREELGGLPRGLADRMAEAVVRMRDRRAEQEPSPRRR